MSRPKCWDGGRHRWVGRTRYVPRESYEKWCTKCGRWFAAMLRESREVPKP